MLKAVFTLEALVDFIFGIALIVAQAALLSIYGMATDRDGAFLGQFLGGTFIGIGLISWFARNWPDTHQRRLVLRAFFVTTGIGFLVSLNYQLQPGAPVLGVVFVLLTLLFGLAWGYFAAGTFRPTEAAR
jgi:hypothetical protein